MHTPFTLTQRKSEWSDRAIPNAHSHASVVVIAPSHFLGDDQY